MRRKREQMRAASFQFSFAAVQVRELDSKSKEIGARFLDDALMLMMMMTMKSVHDVVVVVAAG